MERYVRAGDRRAFEELYRRYSGRLYGLFLRAVHDEAAARDLVQKTFLHFHRARRDYTQGRPLRPWIYTIALNLRREHFRRRARKPETSYDPATHGELTTQPAATTATDRLVRRALAALPDNQREVILLHWYEDMPFAEIAQVVGASVSAVKVRAHRGYERLRVALAPSGEGPAWPAGGNP